MTLSEQQDYDKALIKRLGVKYTRRFVIGTDQGNLYMVYDGKEYWFELNDELVEKGMLDFIPEILRDRTK